MYRTYVSTEKDFVSCFIGDGHNHNRVSSRMCIIVKALPIVDELTSVFRNYAA